MHQTLRLAACLLALGTAGAVLSPAIQSSSPVIPRSSGNTTAAPTDLPADFIENRGQWNGSARFVARRGPVAVALEPQAIRVQLGLVSPAGVTLTFEGGSTLASLVGEERQPTHYNFFGGNDPSGWRTDVPGFRSVLYKRIYDGVDIRLHNQADALEYDVVLQPGADPRRVVVRVDGADSIAVSPDGGLLVRTARGVLTQTRPAAFQTRPDGTTRRVTGTFRIIDAQRYGFDVPDREASLPLVIDPGLVWSTLTGGTSGEQLAGLEAARDGSGDLFISGTTYSPDFATGMTSPQTARYKSFVARLDASGGRYDFVTFINGLQNQTYAGGMAADAGGGVTLVGTTVDLDFPVTPGAFQTSLASIHTGQSEGDGFVMRLNATGGIVFSTYLGGSGNDGAGDVVIDSAGQVVVTGTTNSTDFPTTVGAYDRVFNTPPAGDNTAYPLDAFIARLSANGSQLTYGTFYGGQTYETIQDAVIDPQGFLTIVGVTTSSATGRDIPLTADAFDSTWNGSEDGYIARFKLDGAGTADLKYASFLGGVNQDVIEGVAIDPANPQLVTVAGWAWYDSFTGPFFPTTAGVVKPRLTPQPPPTQLFPHNKTGFVARFRFPVTGAASLLWSTFAGGNWEDFLSDVAVDETGAVIVVGGTRSYDLQTTRGAVDRTQDGVGSDAHDCFVWKLSPNADQLLYSSYLGGTYEDCEAALTIGAKVAYLGNNTIALAGMTGSGDFETTAGAVLRAADEVTDGVNPFVAKLTLAADASGDLAATPPTLLSPANGSTTGSSGGAVRFRWSDVPDPSGIESYMFELSNRSDFAPDFTQKISTNSSELILDSMSLIQWFWRVRTADRAGNLSDFSPANTFTAGVSGAPPVINFVQTYPTTITGGGSAQGVLHLTDAAPAGGLQAILSTKDSRGYLRTASPVTVPTTVSIPAGAISANFSIATSAVNASTPAAIYATTNAFGAKGSIGVGIPSVARAASLMLDPFAVSGGHPATGTVTLTGPAPAGGVVVPLVSSHPQYASVPASVTVPAGAKSATFPVTTSTVPFSIDVMIEATGGEFAARRLALKASGGPRLTSFTLSKATASGGDTVTGTVTFSGPIPPSPFPATGDAIVTIKSTSPALGFLPQVAVPVGSSTATFSILVRNVPATTTLDVIAAYDDAALRAPLTISGTAASLASMTVNVSTLTGGQGGVGFVNLTAPAPAGHVLVDLSTDNPSITLPPNVTISQGSTNGLFSFGALPVDVVTPVTISATYGASRASAGVTINPSTNVWVTSLALSPTTVTAGNSSTGTVTINAPAPSGGATVQISPWSPATGPATVTVPAGSTTATFTVGTTSVSSTTQAKVWAVLNTSWGAVLTVTPGAASGPSLSTLSLSPTTVTGGSSSQGTVTLSGPAPSGGSVVTLSSSNTGVATVPASVTVAAGASSRTFTVTTTTVSSQASATITGTLGVSRSATITVNPAAATPAAPTLLAPANGATVTLPVTLDWNDVTGAASYQIQIEDSSTFSAPFVIDQTVTTSQFTLSAATGQRWWRVRGRNSAGTAGAWSAVRTFTPDAGTPPPPPPPGTSRTLTVTASGRSGERITSSPTGINVAVGSTGSAMFGSGTSITLSVSNGRDAIWSGACSSGGNKTKTCTFTLNADATVTANVQ